MSSRVSLLVFWLLAWVQWIDVVAQDPVHRSFTSQDGLASDHVYCAFEDAQGFIWFGTDAGVSRFDGTAFRNWGLGDGLPDSDVIGIDQDSKGRIWFLTLNGELSYWLDGTIWNGRSIPQLGRYRSTAGWFAFAEDAEGWLWFSGVRGDVLGLDLHGGNDILVEAHGLVRSVVRLANGEVILLDRQQCRLAKHGQLMDFPGILPPILKAEIQRTNDRVDAHAVLGVDRIYRLDINGFSEVPGSSDLMDRALHRACMMDDAGRVWLYRNGRGVDLLGVGTTGQPHRNNLFATSQVNRVVPDSKGNTWLCTTKGVLLVGSGMLENTAWYRPDERQGAVFLSLARIPAGILVGTDRGSVLGLRHDAQLLQEHAHASDELGRLTRLVNDGVGNVWAVADRGVMKLTQALDKGWVANVVEINYSTDLRMFPKDLGLTSDGRVWLAGTGLGAFRPSEPAPQWHWDPNTALMKERIESVHPDGHGGIWLGAGDRLLELHGDSLLEHVWHRPGGASRITDIAAWNGDTLVVSTSGDGVWLWARYGDPVQLTHDNMRIHEGVRRVRVHGDTIWCATRLGAVACVVRHGKVFDHWRYDRTEGLPTNNVYDLVVNNENLHLASEVGLLILPLRPYHVQGAVPKVKLVTALVNGYDIGHLNGTLPVSVMDHVRVKASAMEFLRADAVRYAFRLGDDGAWQQADGGQIFLGQLSEGDQVLHVRARIAEGPWSDTQTLTIAVSAPWWASVRTRYPALMLLVALAVIIISLSLKRGYERALGHYRVEAARQEERQRIAADLHDDLGADLSGVLMHLRRKPTEGTLDRAATLVQQCMHKIDEIIWSMDPGRDTLVSTVDFIEKLAREACQEAGVSFRTDVRIPQVPYYLPAEKRRAIVLCAREAIRNAMVHARASTLVISWQLKEQVVQLVIADDGVGIAALPDFGSRHGLRNMHRRAQEQGWDLAVERIVPHGTEIKLHMPLQAVHQNG